MTGLIAAFESPLIVVGGGPTSKIDIEEVHRFSPHFVAADGGARAILDAGLMPEAVIGDLDSLEETDRIRLPAERIHRITEQDSTDFDKVLRNVRAPLIIALGFTGARLDHQLAALNSLARYRAGGCVLVGESELIIHVPKVVNLPLEENDLVSLFPMAPVRGQSTGLRWPIDGLEFSPDGRVGTSNRAMGPVRLDMDGPGMLVMVPRRALVGVIEALSEG